LAIGAHGIRRAEVREGEFVLVIGAGPIGLATMKFAQIAGGRVIAMDVNENRLQFCSEKLKIGYTLKATGNVVEQLKEITNGDMPTVVIDATGNQKAINNALQYVAHGGRYVLIGLQKSELIFSHPEFHKRETTLLSSRNATLSDFEFVNESIKEGLIDPSVFITTRMKFREAKDNFASLVKYDGGVIKPVIEME
jgi:threonine dehydrogenase-like Zn-dependent dehydrogenase